MTHKEIAQLTHEQLDEMSIPRRMGSRTLTLQQRRELAKYSRPQTGSSKMWK